MSFWAQAFADAQPKADTLKKATSNIAHKVAASKAAKGAKNLAYKGFVNTVMVGVAIAAPTVVKVWDKVVEAAQEPEPTK